MHHSYGLFCKQLSPNTIQSLDAVPWQPILSICKPRAAFRGRQLKQQIERNILVCASAASLHRRCRYGMQVQALDSLAKALHVEVLELRRERARALSSRGLWGHLKNLLGYLLSAYCLFKYVVVYSPALTVKSACDRSLWSLLAS